MAQRLRAPRSVAGTTFRVGLCHHSVFSRPQVHTYILHITGTEIGRVGEDEWNKKNYNVDWPDYYDPPPGLFSGQKLGTTSR